MLFNSLTFLIFFTLVFLVYWFLLKETNKGQNLFLLLVSYVFYGWWDWRFLSLIILSSAVDYTLGFKMGHTIEQRKRKRFLILSLLVNLGMLGTFKYFNFFAESFFDLFSLVGLRVDPITLNIILPVGISFYTFQTLSYTIDVYKNQLAPVKDPIEFFAFVSFFPQLVAGPIERAKQLLPQFSNPRIFNFNQSVDGLRQILWGLFKKVVIADNCAPLVNTIFDNHETLPGSILIIGSILFAFQIYGDFSGYSDMAIGLAKLLGFNLMTNFKYPYLSRDIAEFWRRWHISLSTWFRDYLYIPLGGSRGSTYMVLRNIFIIFLVSGFWHGANWTFIFWGGLNALFFVPLYLFNLNRNNTGDIDTQKWLPSFSELFMILITFTLTCFAWIFFRAENLTQAFSYIQNIFAYPFIPISFAQFAKYKLIFACIALLMIFEWFNREKEFGLDLSKISLRPLRWSIYYGLLFIIVRYSGTQQDFIYFQF